MPTVLVVDDMPIIRGPIANCLEGAGFQTLCAASGLEALDLVGQHRPDLILLDLEMPLMDGMTFLRLLRNHPAGRDIPVILLTAEDQRSTVLQAVKLGVKGYILKSNFSLTDLLARVREQLSPATAIPVHR